MTGVGPSKLFAADSANRAIRSLANANPSAGTLVADRIIQGPVSTGLSFSINSLVLDSTLDYLYVGNGTSIRVFYGASMANYVWDTAVHRLSAVSPLPDRPNGILRCQGPRLR